MRHKIFVEDGVLQIAVKGDLSDDELRRILDTMDGYSQRQIINKKMAYALIDTTELGRATPKGRKLALDGLKKMHFDKFVVYGQNAYAKYVSLLAIKALRLKKMHYFDTHEQALAWLSKVPK